MRKTEFRTPLLQSGAILFIFLVFFLFVISSEASGFGNGLLAIASGVFHSILFTIGLLFSILFSIIVLIALFFATITLYSRDKAKDLWTQLQSTLGRIFSTANDHISFRRNQYLDVFRSQSTKIHQLEKEVIDLTEQNRQLRYSLNKMEKELEQLQVTSRIENI